MRKACSQGSSTRRCFIFNPGAIRAWLAAMRLKVHGPGSIAILPSGKLDRCAVVLSGHVLRCSSQPWAEVIDSAFYDAVFRTNVFPTAHPGCPASAKLAEVQAHLDRHRSWVRTKNREHTGPGFKVNPGRRTNHNHHVATFSICNYYGFIVVFIFCS